MTTSVDEFLKLNIDLKEKVISFPTDTVYGIGCLCTDIKGIDKIYRIKERSIDKAIPILISNIKQLDGLVEIVEDKKESIYKLLNEYWPGAVTFIFKKKDSFNYSKDTLAIRMPNSDVALKLIDHYGPMSVTSMNKSGSNPLTKVSEIEKFNDIDFIINDERSFSNVSSTICSLVTNELTILRQGSVIIKEKTL